MNPDKKNEFDRQLAGRFENFRPDVPNGLWDKIASTLDEQEQSNIVLIKQRRRFPTRWIAVAASLLVVSGMVYWYNRPVAVTYLQNAAAQVEEAEIPAVEERIPEPEPMAEPLDTERLKQLFAKRNRPAKSENEPEMKIAERLRVAETPRVDRSAGTTDNQPLTDDVTALPTQRVARSDESVIPPSTPPAIDETVAATVPDIQPPVVLEDEEETLLAASEAGKQPFGVSNILNYVVGAVDQREEKLVTFSNDGEGSLKLDFNFSLAKNKNKRIK